MVERNTLLNEMYRTAGGAAADVVDSTTGLGADLLNPMLRRAGIGQVEGTNLGGMVPQPAATGNRVMRSIFGVMAPPSKATQGASAARTVIHGFESGHIPKVISRIEKNQERIDSDSMFDDANQHLLERRYTAYEAIKNVFKNNEVANKRPDLKANQVFLYDSPSPNNVSAALHMEFKADGTAEVKWVGSIRPGEGVKLLQQAGEIARSRGVTKITGAAQWDSSKLYKRMGATTTGRYDPLNQNQPVEIDVNKMLR